MNLIKIHIKKLKVASFLLVISLFILYMSNNYSELQRIKTVNMFYILAIVIGQLTVLTSSALMLREVAKQNGSSINNVTLAEITTYSSLVNFFGFLQGGVGVRAIFLNLKHSISYQKFLSFTLLQYLSLFYISSILFIVPLTSLSSRPILEAIAIALLISPMFFKKIRIPYDTKKMMFSKLSSRFSFYNLRNVTVINLLQIFGCLIIYGISLKAVNARVDFSSLLIYTSISQFALAFAITPGAIGVREGLLLIVANSMGVGLNDIVIASTLERLLLFLTFAIITPFFFLARKKYKILFKKGLESK